MLTVTNVYKPVQQRLSIEVRVEGVTVETSDACIRSAAKIAARESDRSLFGSSVQRYNDGTALVKLHRD